VRLAVKRPEDVVKTVLCNGLTAVVQRLPYAPVAAVTIAYRTGSLWETDLTRGYSHLCEHLMFRGSEGYGPGEYWRVVQRNGGHANAYTSRDITVYYSILPAAGLVDVLDLEADRMFRCTMDDDHVASETAIIMEEELLTHRDDPQGSLEALMYATAFRRHPYGRPIIGTAEDIRNFSADRLRDFYRNFYRPGNAVISVVGDIHTEPVLSDIKSIFSDQGSGSVLRPEPTEEPPQRAQRRVSLEHPSQLPGLSIGFRVPGGGHRDSAALSLISIYLASGRSSRLEEVLVRTSAALEASASSNTNLMPGLFAIRAVLPENGSTDEVEEIIFRELESIADGSVDGTTAARLTRKRIAWSLISDADPPGRSRRFSTGYARYDDPFFYWGSVESLLSVTPGDIRRVAGSYLTSNNSTVAVLRPAGKGNRELRGSSSRLDDAAPDMRPPDIQSPWDVEVPDRLLVPPSRSAGDGIREEYLENGLRLVLRTDSSFPTFSLGFSFPMGSSMEPPELTGLAQMTAETMLHGTPGQSSIEFHARLEDLGASIELSSAGEFSGGVITSLSRDFDSVVSVISDLLRYPAFRKEDLMMVRSDAVSSLEEWLGTPLGAAMDSFAKLSTVPRELSSIPTRATLEAISRDDLVSFHEACCRPGGSVIVAVGNFDGEKMLRSLEKGFSNWTQPGYSLPEPLPVRNSRKSSEERIRLEGREQVALIMATPAPPMLHSDSEAIAILNRILGDGIGSRLGRNIREAGLSYHVSSIYLPFRSRGRIASLVLTSPSAFERSMEGLRHELGKISEEEVGESELRLEKASYMGQQELAMMNYGYIARTLLTSASLGLPLDHDRRMLEKVSALTAKDLLEAARRWLGSGIEWVSIAGGI